MKKLVVLISNKGTGTNSSRESNVTTMAQMVTNNDCSISSLDLCLKTIKEVALDPDLAFPITKDDLKQACW